MPSAAHFPHNFSSYAWWRPLAFMRFHFSHQARIITVSINWSNSAPTFSIISLYDQGIDAQEKIDNPAWSQRNARLASFGKARSLSQRRNKNCFSCIIWFLSTEEYFTLLKAQQQLLRFSFGNRRRISYFLWFVLPVLQRRESLRQDNTEWQMNETTKFVFRIQSVKPGCFTCPILIKMSQC